MLNTKQNLKMKQATKILYIIIHERRDKNSKIHFGICFSLFF